MIWKNAPANGNWGDEGPWGRRSQTPKGGEGGDPPDFEDIIRKGQERLRKLTNNNWGGSFLLPIILLAIIGLWLVKAIYVVEPDQVGVELVFGKAKTDLQQPGLHFYFWPVESVELVATQAINQENIGFGDGQVLPGGEREGLMLSGDQNIVDMQFTVLWRIADPFAYLFNVRKPKELVRLVAESAMRGYVGRVRADAVRTTGREAAQDTVKQNTQRILNEYNVGVTINGVRLEKADPPPAVVDAFEDVQRAKQDQDRMIEEANTYSNKRLGQARGQVAQAAEQARGYAGAVVAQANGEAKRFEAIYQEYRNAPDITRRRLFYETMEKIYGQLDKIIIDDDSLGKVIPYLPLNELRGAQKSGSEASR